jgi:hypothetical protein
MPEVAQRLACQVAFKQDAPGDYLNIAITTTIPHATRNTWLIYAPGGVEQFDAIRKNGGVGSVPAAT